MTNIPADKTAKRISTNAWLVRSGMLAKTSASPVRQEMRPPADRIAVRS